MKTAYVTAYVKKKDDYGSISILPNLSKVFIRSIYNKLSLYFDNILSKYQCGFRKGFDAQNYLIKLSEKWKQCLDLACYLERL